MKSFKSLLDKMEEFLPVFEDKVLPFPFARKGIWQSEAFSVCALSSILGIENLIESGVLRGRSTEMFAKYGLNILSVDRTRDKTMSRFDAYPNVKITIANSQKMLPELGRQAVKKTGVFIDGPKGVGACKLARRMLKHPNVAFVGIHDQRIGHFHVMDKYFPEVIYTDESCFRKRFGYLDKEAQNTPVPKRLPDPSGPTIGFVIKGDSSV